MAAYRFGHTMIRDDYDFNVNFNRGGEPAFPATLDLLFTFTALSGQLGEFDTLPDNWIIEWQHFVDTGAGAAKKARRIDTKLAGGLFDLGDLQGEPQRPADAAQLAVRLPAAHPGRFELADLLQFARVLRADWAGHTSTPAVHVRRQARKIPKQP